MSVPKILDYLKLSYLISKRIRHAASGSFSAIIHKIAIGSIAIGLAAAIVSFLVMLGFQTAVKEKIYRFSNHLLITKFTMNMAVEEQPFDYRIALYQQPEKFPFVRHVQEYCHKAGLIKADDEVLGVIFKGVGKSFSVSRFAEAMVEGRFLQFNDSSYSREVVLSRIIANKINAKVGDDIVLHFFQNPPRVRKLKVVGIYETNLSDYFDGKVLMGDIRLVQQLNGWEPHMAGGLEVTIDLKYFNRFELLKNEMRNDTYSLAEGAEGEADSVVIEHGNKAAIFGFDQDKAALDEALVRIGESIDYDLNIETVRDKFINVFEWSDLIKRQVKILLGIILFVISVNMISVILILVMERIPMVGILKSMGGSDKLVRTIFMFSGSHLIARGLLWGNAIGLGVCWLQYQFRFFKLNPRDYYVSFVPIEWDWATVLILNTLVFATVALVLWLPTRYITKISPVQAIRFD
ncbi:MAG: ABC transporter permease [Flammeovirgaceae bacterium]